MRMVISYVIFGLIIIIGLLYSLEYFFGMVVDIGGIATLIAGAVAIVLYYLEQSKRKSDAAKIILQEIRRAEEVVGEYKMYGTYKFTRKIVITNTWKTSIHYFVSDLTQEEIDKISNLYSTWEYIDSLIRTTSDSLIKYRVECISKADPSLTDSIKIQEEINRQMDATRKIESVASDFLHMFSQSDIIYYSSICEKLKIIAKIS